MKLLNLLIPKENFQTIKEIESYTVTWRYKKRDSSYLEFQRSDKVFINKSEAQEFKKQLEESAKFIGCYISTELNKN